MRYIHAELLVREIMTLGHLILQKQAKQDFTVGTVAKSNKKS
jgi:hypothetical protein